MKKILLLWGLLWGLNVNAQVRLVNDINYGATSSYPVSMGTFNDRALFEATVITSFKNFYLTEGGGVRAFRTFIDSGVRSTLGTSGKPYINLNGQILTISPYSGPTNNMCFLTKCDGATINTGGYENNVISTTGFLGVQGTSFRLGDPVVLNNKVIYAPKPSSAYGQPGDELCIADENSSSILKDIWIGANTSSPREMTVVGTKCYFSANDGALGRELWETDGTSTGTVLFSDINAGATGSNPEQLNAYGTFLVFVATHPTLGKELFKINSIGTLTSLKNINPSGDSNPTNVTVIGTSIYFGANNGTSGNELWLSTGTSSSTNLVKDINTAGDSNPDNFTSYNGWIYFTADDGTNGVELWKTDGTNAGTTLVSNINPTGASNPTDFEIYKGRLYFTADDGTTGRQLYYLDASSVVYKIVINPSGDSLISGLTATSTELYFGADAGTGIGKELYAFNDAVLASNEFQLAGSQIKMYPNPSKNYFELSGDVSIDKVEIFSIQGQLVKSFQKENQYAVYDLSKGLYIVKIKAAEGILNKTLIIE